MESLRVGYYNITGIDCAKIDHLTNSFLPHFDIFIIAETMQARTREIRTNPYFLAMTPYIHKHRMPRHGKAGMAIFGLPHIKKHLKSITVENYTITINIGDITIVSLYLPPSMSNVILEETLQNCKLGGKTVVVGDINIRFGSITGDTATSAPERRESWYKWCTPHALHMILPDEGMARVDHVFSTPNLPVHWKYTKDSLISSKDHELMDITIQTTCENNDYTDNMEGPKRYNLKYLQDPIIRALMRQEYRERRKRSDAPTNIRDLTEEQQQKLVDKMERAIMTCINGIAEDFIGTYCPVEVKMSQDKMLSYMEKADIKHVEAIRLFKRAQRATNAGAVLQSRDGTITAVEDFQRYFEEAFQSLPPPKMKHKLPPNGEDEITKRFNKNEITTFFKKYPKTRSCGKDGVHQNLICALWHNALDNDIVLLFQLCAKLGTTPTHWNTSITYPLAKIKNARYVGDCRPVALTNTIRRAFEAILYRTIQKDTGISEKLNLNFGQGGFRRYLTTLLHAAASHDYQVENGGHQVFIDLKSAYDRVNLDLLLKKLEDREVPVRIISIIASLFRQCKTQVVVNGILTKPITLNTGLFQGSILSPLLWNIYIDDLAKTLNGSLPIANVKALFWADDIKVQYPKGTPWSRIQKDLIEITKWAEEHNMICGLKKCAIILGPNEDGNIQLQLAQAPLPISDEYKYLGFEMGHMGIKFPTFVNRIVSKVEGLLSFLERNSGSWRASVRLIIYRTFVRPVLEYGSPLIMAFSRTHMPENSKKRTFKPMEDIHTAPLLKQFEDIHKRAMAWIYNTNLEAVNKTHASLAGILVPKDRLQLLEAGMHLLTKRAPSWTPAKLLQQVFTSRSRWYLTQRLQKSEVAKQFESEMDKGLTAGEVLDFGTWKQKHTTKLLAKEYGDLGRYVRPVARTGGGTDKIFFAEHSISRLGLRWRLNKPITGYSCMTCVETLARRHFRCRTVDTIIKKLTAEYPDIAKSADLFKKQEKAENFTIIDQAMNMGRLEVFVDFLEMSKAQEDEQQWDLQGQEGNSTQGKSAPEVETTTLVKTTRKGKEKSQQPKQTTLPRGWQLNKVPKEATVAEEQTAVVMEDPITPPRRPSPPKRRIQFLGGRHKLRPGLAALAWPDIARQLREKQPHPPNREEPEENQERQGNTQIWLENPP